MHGGFGGGGHGGGGHGAGGHGSGHGGGGHGHATHATHSGHAHNQPIAAHNLGGQSQSQSVLGHMTSLVSNGQGVLGHIAGWLVGHHGVVHHAAGQNQHVGDASWTSAALQVDKSEKWHQKVIKLPGVHILAIFLVVAGWLVFLGMLRHGDAEHVARSPMPTQQEWRQELVGANGEGGQQQMAEGDQGNQQAPEAAAAFGGPTAMFGSPRAGTESSPLAYVQAPMQQADPQLMQQQQSVQQYQGQQMQPQAAPASQQPAQLGRRSFSARSQLGSEGLDSRGFHHKVVTER